MPSHHRFSEADSPVEKVFISAGRTIARCIDLWCDVEKVITIAKMIEQDEDSKAGKLKEDKTIKQVRDDRLKEYDEEARHYYLTTYRKILQITPGLAPLIADPKRSTELVNITRKMVDIINNTRSIDTTKLKSYIAQYAAPEPNKAALDPPIVNINGRDQLGLKHPVLARFICPMEALAAFDENPDKTLELLQHGKIPMRAENFPSVFWSGDKYPGDSYDPEDMCKGLFRGYMLVRIARHIFLGPTSALNAALKKGTKSCNAFLHDMTTVEPEHIAYVCVQTRFAISSMPCWSEQDGQFSFRELYRLVVYFIENAVDVGWKEELLQWWNLQMFGNKRGRGFEGRAKSNCNSASSSSPGGVGMLGRMRAQMEARMAAKRLTTGDPSTRPESSDTDLASSQDRQAPPPPFSSDQGGARSLPLPCHEFLLTHSPMAKGTKRAADELDNEGDSEAEASRKRKV
ncbi:hypothetical protein JVT61DRAFT_12328 [Boletus reticuloceps]|uniref:Uncharacterized protein n=1 Tax=Boletus reticuloceps TaxID=495285 RepID=A0A8I2YDY2_9AGAM|nr:hypothetical protein JVT61DRAFT_12328 [Boletus reticuloceps]